MNKLLLGTTALVGASLLMAGGAYAAKPKVSVNGAVDVQWGGATQDLDSVSDAVGLSSAGPNRGQSIRTDSEVHFNIRGKTDAGMKWRAQVQFEADTNVSANDAGDATESALDETWIRFSGSWGQVNLGSDDGAEDLMHVSGEKAVNKAGDGGFDGDWDKFVDWNAVNGRFADQPTLEEDSSDATKVSYFTPRISGFQVGVSFTPDEGATGSATNTDSTGDRADSWGLGVNYKGKFGGVKVAAAGVALIANQEDETTEDHRGWMIGAEVGYGGWKLGAGYQDNGDGGEPKGVADDDAWAFDVGLGYASGPVHLGVSWLHTEVEKGSAGDDEGDAVFLGATYMLGGGARVYAEIFWFDTESAGGESAGTSNEGFAFLIGTGVKF